MKIETGAGTIFTVNCVTSESLVGTNATPWFGSAEKGDYKTAGIAVGILKRMAKSVGWPDDTAWAIAEWNGTHRIYIMKEIY